MLIGAVVVHEPDFFGAGAGADESDLRAGDAGETAAEFVDDFVGELVSEAADLRVGGSAAIDLGDNRLSGGIANVEEPGLDGYFGGGFGEIAEGDHAGVGWSIGPSEIAQFGRLRGGCGG